MDKISDYVAGKQTQNATGSKITASTHKGKKYVYKYSALWCSVTPAFHTLVKAAAKKRNKSIAATVRRYVFEGLDRDNGR